jgi:hypothetical protein
MVTPIMELLKVRQEAMYRSSTGATSDPLAEPPGSRGRKAINPYEGAEADDDPGPSLRDVIEDHTPATDELLEGGEEG